MKEMSADYLADRFVEAQSIERAAAVAVAVKILNGDEDIALAAREWASHRSMVQSPTVEGHTPASLAAAYTPTQVFTILMALRRDPARAQQMLKRFHG